MRITLLAEEHSALQVTFKITEKIVHTPRRIETNPHIYEPQSN
mgnify:CR=1 FL=1